VRGELTETLPVSFWQHHPIADQASTTLADATCRFQKEFDLDLVKVTPASTWQLRDFGLSDKWEGDLIGRRAFGPPVVKQAEDWHRLTEMIFPNSHAAIHLDAARQIRKRVSSEVPVLQTVFNPMFLAQMLSQHYWSEHIRTNREDVQLGLDALTDATCRLIEMLFDVGIDGIYFAVQHATDDLMRYEDYAALAAPSDRTCLEVARKGGRLNLIHFHGDRVHTGLIPSYPVHALHYNFTAHNPLPETVADENQALVSGGPSSEQFFNANPEEISTEVRSIRSRMRGHPYMLSAGCVCYPDTPSANIHAAIAMARRRETI